MAYQTSQGLASLGRNGDSMLVHMNPTEVAGLQSLAMSQGGSLTINPDTGLPEAFSLSGVFSSLLPMFAGAMFPGAGFAMQPLLAGALTGGVLAKVQGKDPLMGGLMGGLGGIGGSNLSFGLGNMSTGAAGAAAQGGGGYVPSLLQSGKQAVTQGAGIPNTGSFLDKELTALSNAGRGAGDLITGKPGAFDAFKNAYAVDGAQPLTNFQAATKIGLPVGGALLGGLEPSDLYGEPINMDEAKRKQRYDPNATLNLSGDTGLRLYATGGTIQSGGIRDLYGTPDNQPTISPGLSGFGLGRLNNLAGEQAMTQAQTLGYAMGGPVSFADGGDSNKEDALGLPSLSPDMSMDPNAGAGNLAMIQSAMQPTQGMQGNAPMTQGQMPDQSNDSLIAKVTANLRADPNYQPTNPIEASIVKQIRGTDPMQQGQPSLQGLGSLAPSQPMAPSFNPSVAIGPTYFAGMNAPRGYAEGGDISNYRQDQAALNLDRLPSLNVNAPRQFTAADFKPNSNPPIMNDMLALMMNKAITGGQFNNASPGVKSALNIPMAKGGYLDGQGDGMSDSIPATIEGKQPARLADGEFVIPADVVSHLGNGSSKAGSKRLYAMLDKVRHARTGNKKQGKEIKPEKYMPA
jgi:hypothetical protein